MAEGPPSARLDLHRRLRGARRLSLVLGDQLDRQSAVLDALDRQADAVLMMEVAEETEHVASHRQRTALFLAAMRHFGLELIDRGFRVRYVRLDENGNSQSFEGEVDRAVRSLAPERVLVVRPGEHRVSVQLEAACSRRGTPLEIFEDPSFTCSLAEFEAWAHGRKQLTLEYFYRHRRRELDLLLASNGYPVGGRWNFDKENREAFPSAPEPPKPYRARPDDITREVIELVQRRWPRASGRMDGFQWPVTPAQARRALDRFIWDRLPQFGRFQDAMWSKQPFLYHSLLSSSLNLKLIRPAECVEAALASYHEGRAPLASVEGFIRQIVGWREFVRGVYYREGEGYPYRNGLDQRGELPSFFWTGETDMACLRHALSTVIDYAYGHHIERLMVIGNFALIAGVHPRAVHEWFLAMYVDAVDWVTAPNVIGMSQHADGGVVGSKPYAASGKYIDRMSNYCRGCRYDTGRRTGDSACPFNTLYWDFLIRHRERLSGNRRMAMMLANAGRIEESERDAIVDRASELRRLFEIGDF